MPIGFENRFYTISKHQKIQSLEKEFGSLCSQNALLRLRIELLQLKNSKTQRQSRIVTEKAIGDTFFFQLTS